jgi:hypothetical protein
MDLYTRTSITSLRYDDLAREASDARRARGDDAPGGTAPVRAFVTRLTGRLGALLGAGRDVRTVRPVVRVAPQG